MKLTHIRDIAAIADHGSLRAAARHLGVAQPAITRSIRELEHELGVTLFERNARGVALTPIGKAFLRRATAAQNELRQARDEIRQLKGETTGQVSVALSTGSHIALLPRALAPFRERYPDISIRIVEALFPSLEQSLRDGTLDFYVGPLPETPTPKELLVEKLFDNTRVVFGRKGHALARATTLAELTSAHWITTSVTSKSDAELYPLFKRHGLPPPDVRVHTSSALSMMIVAANSDLLMMLPKQWLDFPATLAMLEPIFVKELLPAAPICIVRRTQLPLTPAAEYFSDMLRRSSEYYVSARKRSAP